MRNGLQTHALLRGSLHLAIIVAASVALTAVLSGCDISINGGDDQSLGDIFSNFWDDLGDWWDRD